MPAYPSTSFGIKHTKSRVTYMQAPISLGRHGKVRCLTLSKSLFLSFSLFFRPLCPSLSVTLCPSLSVSISHSPHRTLLWLSLSLFQGSTLALFCPCLPCFEECHTRCKSAKTKSVPAPPTYARAVAFTQSGCERFLRCMRPPRARKSRSPVCGMSVRVRSDIHPPRPTPR